MIRIVRYGATAALLLGLAIGVGLLVISRHPIPLGESAQPLLARAAERVGYRLAYEQLSLGFDAPSRQLEMRARKLVLTPLSAAMNGGAGGEVGGGEAAPEQGAALQADEAHFSLHLMPLLAGQLDFDRVELSAFSLNLQRDPAELERLRQLTDGSAPAEDQAVATPNWWQQWPALVSGLHPPLNPNWPNLSLQQGTVTVGWGSDQRRLEMAIDAATLSSHTHYDLGHHLRPEKRWQGQGNGQLKWYGWGKTDGQSAWSVSLSDNGAWNGQLKPVPLMLLSDALAMPIPEPWQGAVGLQADLSLGYQPPASPHPPLISQIMPHKPADSTEAKGAAEQLMIGLTLPTQTLDWPGVFPQPVVLREGAVTLTLQPDAARPDASTIRLMPSSLHLGNGRFDFAGEAKAAVGQGASSGGGVSGGDAMPNAPAAVPMLSTPNPVALSLNLTAGGLSFNDLPLLWPQPMAVNPRNWVTQHLRDGSIQQAQMTLTAQLDPANNSLPVVKTQGTITVQGSTVDYFPPLPPIEKVDGIASFTETGMDITLTSGQQAGSRLKQGKVGISGFDKPDQLIDIAVELAGPLADAMAIIGHPKLQLIQELGLKPEGINGDGQIALKFQFPLQNSLRLPDVATTVRAKLANVVVANLVNQHGVSDGNLTLDLDNKGMVVAGQVKLAGAPLEIKWQEWFNPMTSAIEADPAPLLSAQEASQAAKPGAKSPTAKTPQTSKAKSSSRTVHLQRDITFKGTMDADAYRRLEMPANALEAGVMQLNGRYQVYDGKAGASKSRLNAEWQADQAAVNLADLNWRKDIGQPLRGDVDLGLANGAVQTINRFALMGSGANVIVFAKIDPKTAVATQLQASQLKIGRTDVRLNLSRKPPARANTPAGAWTGTLTGNGLDLSGAFASGQADKETPELPAMQLDVALEQLYLANNIGLRHLRGYLHRTDNHWQRYQLTADWPDQKAEQKSEPASSNQKDGGSSESSSPTPPPVPALKLQLQDQSAGRVFQLASSNAGRLFEGLNLGDNLRGGVLAINAQLTNPSDNRDYHGTVEIKDPRLVKAPLLARLISLAFPTGLLQALGGEGIAFSQLQANIARQNQLLTITDGRLYGSSLGLTAKGQVDLGKNQINLSGVIVPAYAVNNLFARIPLIGGLLGGDSAGGLLATNYSATGALDNPDISVNPLSMLTPGALRGIFGNGAPTETPAPPSAQPGETPPKPNPATGSNPAKAAP
jgi:hypothetical protein